MWETESVCLFGILANPINPNLDVAQVGRFARATRLHGHAVEGISGQGKWFVEQVFTTAVGSPADGAVHKAAVVGVEEADVVAVLQRRRHAFGTVRVEGHGGGN